MPFQAGQTFLYPLDSRPHLWVIATNPNVDDLFAIVNFTSLIGAKDQTVIIRAKEHPFIKWDTCVNYRLAEITNSGTVQAYIDCGLAQMHADVSSSLLELIVDGFRASNFTKNGVREFVTQSRTPR